MPMLGKTVPFTEMFGDDVERHVSEDGSERGMGQLGNLVGRGVPAVPLILIGVDA